MSNPIVKIATELQEALVYLSNMDYRVKDAEKCILEVLKGLNTEEPTEIARKHTEEPTEETEAEEITKSRKTIHVIGFGGEFYTHWSYTEVITNKRILESLPVFHKNISTDLEKATAWAESENLDYYVDYGQKGRSWEDQFIPAYRMPFKNENGLVRECTSIWHLWTVFTDNFGVPKRKELAKARLDELGALTEYKGELLPDFEIKRRVERDAQIKDHHYEDKKRLDLSLTFLYSTSYDTQYGTTYIQNFIDGESRVFTYKGSNPIASFEKGDEVKVKATIKHTEYKGERQTLIQRLKQI